ncbi:TonB-dependent receptor [candidate division KSB1 bacterium]|nr:TonB-dependent receptor [candidate division KSB1 bacterium]
MAEPDESLRPGIIKGTILDESTQIPLPAATIMIDDTPLGAAADMEGQYFIERIPPGIYNVRFMMIGYETRVVNSVVVNPGLTTWLTVELKSTVLEMEGVSITAGFFQEAKDAVISNRSMDFEEIRMDPGSVGDIQRVVQALPSVVSGSDQDNEIIVRGGMPGENLFIMDHIEIPNPNHFASQGLGGGPINMINTEFVRRIDFYAGAFPARYGDKASSAMEISLREGSRDRITGHAYLGMAGVGAMIEGPIKNRGSYMFSARKSFLDLIISSTGLTAVPHYYSLQGKVVVDLNATNQLIWNGIFGDDEITIDEDEGGGYERGAENVKSESYQYATGITLRSLYGKKGFSRITLSQVANNWDQFVWESDGDPYFTNQSTEIERTLKADWTYQLSKRLEFSVGGHVKSIPFDIDIWADADTMFVFQPGTTQILSDSIIYPEYKRMEKETTLKTAGFLQVKWNPWDRLTLSMGLRGDHFKYTDKLSLDPRIGFSYAITEKTDLNFAVGQFSQSPAYVQITAHPGNNSLDYKSNRQIAGGFSRLFTEDMRGTVEVFYKDYFNVPISKASLTPNPFDASNGHLVNEGEGYAKGFEFFLQKKLTHQYHFTLSYAYSISKGRDPRNGEQFSWDYDYRQHFTFIGGAHYDLRNKEWYKSMKKHWLYDFFGWLVPLADQVEVGVRWRYLGGRPYSERTYHPEYRRWVVEPSTPFNGLRYPQYHRLDFRVDWRHMYNSWNMVAFLDIMNIYARDNIWMYSYNADGTVENVYQFQVFPVGGVSIEF